MQVDADILTALDDGTLAGCTLDVFPREPLPPDSPLWSHPKVTITPHNAGDISPRVFAAHVIAQIERFERGCRSKDRRDAFAGIEPVVFRPSAVPGEGGEPSHRAECRGHRSAGPDDS